MAAPFKNVVLRRNFHYGERYVNLYYNYPALPTDTLTVLMESENVYVGIPLGPDVTVDQTLTNDIRFVTLSGIYEGGTIPTGSSELDSFVLDESTLG